MQIEIKDYSDTHSLVVVINKAKQYSTTWAKEFDDSKNMISPTVEQVKKAFLEDKKSFLPYSVKRGW